MSSSDPLRTVVLRAEGIEARVSPFGATVTHVLVPDRDGVVADVVLGYDDLESYRDPADRPYFGAVVGRVANRVAGARFTLGGREHALAANNGPNCLHGGVEGFDRRWWNVDDIAADGTSVTLSLVSPDGDEGFPGECVVTVIYAVVPDPGDGVGAVLSTVMTATCDRPCPVNLAQHSYFNLRGHDSGVDVMGHSVTLRAGRYTPVDAQSHPDGEIAAVDGTPFDLRGCGALGATAPPPVGEDPGGYDHNFALDGYDASRPGRMFECATARDPESGRCVQVRCDQPGVQLYTGNFLGGKKGKGGATYGKHAGFCLETQKFPDSVNQSAFESCVLEPGATYRHEMSHRFFVE